MVGQPHPCAVGPLDFDLCGGHVPGSGLHFHKVHRRRQRGGPGGGFTPTAPSERLRPEAQLFGNAGEGQHAGKRNGLCPQRLGNPAPRRAPALAPLNKLLGQVVELLFCLRRGQLRHGNLPSYVRVLCGRKVSASLHRCHAGSPERHATLAPLAYQSEKETVKSCLDLLF